MVDRIVPATTDEDIKNLPALIGAHDASPVKTEPFMQWVIEDHFAGDRPDWAGAGALLVDEVAPYELAKLRLLNGPHSAIAYLGYLAGHEYVADAMASPSFAAFVTQLQEQEIAPVTPEPDQMPLAPYMQDLRARFSNTALQHRTWQIAMDGSQKLPQRLLNTIRARLDAGASIKRLSLAVAAWTQYVSGTDEQGNKIDVRDPMAETLRLTSENAGTDPEKRAAAFLSIQEIFGSDLPASTLFQQELADAIRLLQTQGAAGAVQTVSQEG